MRTSQLDPRNLEKAIDEDLAAGEKAVLCGGHHRNHEFRAVDDLTAISEICQRNQLWLHVDGAYGGSAIFSDQHRNLVRGIE